jgi:hypothetical protein
MNLGSAGFLEVDLDQAIPGHAQWELMQPAPGWT